MEQPKKSPSYKDAIQWIANEDEPTLMKVGEVADLISTAMIADLFGLNATDVARDIIEIRRHG